MRLKNTPSAAREYNVGQCWGVMKSGRMPSQTTTTTCSALPLASATAGATTRARAQANKLTAGANRLKPRHTIITNSTYDGLIYNVERVIEIGGDVIDRLHFDEAWYAYARFNPLYRDRHAMFGDPKDHTGPTIFATHSTHKLLAALSQASLLHIRDGRSPIPHQRFNESYMMQASTSPLYTIIVSNDVTAAMMDGPGGLALTDESVMVSRPSTPTTLPLASPN